jgi:ArsR family transcriptional regulator, lead/cadmium/zinc/bismuth-responsive transcriptional repressor
MNKRSHVENRESEAECQIPYVHQERIEEAKAALLNRETVSDLTETFKILSDPTRLSILLALSKTELCVCDIASLLGATDSAVSHQLRLLRNLRLVKYRREGKMAYYSLCDEHIEDMIRVAVRHAAE